MCVPEGHEGSGNPDRERETLLVLHVYMQLKLAHLENRRKSKGKRSKPNGQVDEHAAQQLGYVDTLLLVCKLTCLHVSTVT